MAKGFAACCCTSVGTNRSVMPILASWERFTPDRDVVHGNLAWLKFQIDGLRLVDLNRNFLTASQGIVVGRETTSWVGKVSSATESVQRGTRADLFAGRLPAPAVPIRPD